MTGDDPNARTIESYEDIVDEYAAETEGAGVLAHCLERLAETVPGGQVLEIGSGPGWDADRLETAGLTVQRTDVTQAFLAFQRDRGKDVDELNVLSDDLGGPYDGVVALHVLQHVEDDHLPGVLAKVAAALRPDGRFLVSIPLGEEVGWQTGESGKPYFRALRTEAAFRDQLERAGLAVDWSDRAHQDAEEGWFCALTRRDPEIVSHNS